MKVERNIVIHAFEGEVKFRIDPDFVKVMVTDQGPGIADIELAMQEGYSTAPKRPARWVSAPELGLPNMKRCSDQFTINTEVEKGPRLKWNSC